jgi:hypothetical protein
MVEAGAVDLTVQRCTTPPPDVAVTDSGLDRTGYSGMNALFMALLWIDPWLQVDQPVGRTGVRKTYPA